MYNTDTITAVNYIAMYINVIIVLLTTYVYSFELRMSSINYVYKSIHSTN